MTKVLEAMNEKRILNGKEENYPLNCVCVSLLLRGFRKRGIYRTETVRGKQEEEERDARRLIGRNKRRKWMVSKRGFKM